MDESFPDLLIQHGVRAEAHEHWVAPTVGGVDSEAVMILALIGMVAVVSVVTMFLRARTRIAEKRLEVLQDLARSGHIQPRDVREFLDPRRHWTRVAMVVAWFGLIGGGCVLAGAVAMDWPYRYREVGSLGIAMLAVSLATLSAPIVLKEFKSQGVV